MTASFIDSFVGPIDVGHRSGFVSGFDVRLGPARPSHAVYVRRRLLVGLVFVALCGFLAVTVHSVLADRGGVPASTPAVRPVVMSAGPALADPPQVDDSWPAAAAGPGSGSATGLATDLATEPSATGTPYIVQPGDTLWSIASGLRGRASLSDYVDLLVSANGGASVQAGQLLRLP